MAAPSEPPAIGGRVIRVLVVDDHELVRDTVGAALRAAGDIEVVGLCADGQQAVRAFETEQPDVVVMDLSMPVMSGVDATRRLLRIDPAARIVVLTSARLSRDVEEALAVGALAYVCKDDDIADLIRAVEEAGSRDGSPTTPAAPVGLPVAVPAHRWWRPRGHRSRHGR